MNHEIEIKLQLSIDALKDAGIALESLSERYFEDNWLLDFDRQLSGKSSILRVRVADGKGYLTYKAKAGEDAPATVFKLRVEIETEIGEVDKVLEIFARLGYQKWFRYQKYRTLFKALLPSGNNLQVMVDETPIGNFLELEGEEESIAEAVKMLKLTPQDYLLDSYLALQLAHCQKQGKALEDMVF